MRYLSFILLIFLLFSLSLTYTVAQGQTLVTRERVWEFFLEVYSKTEYLGSKGINVSVIVDDLNRVLDLLYRGDNSSLEEAYNILLELNTTCNRLLEELPSVILWRNIRLYSTVGVLASIPILSYIFIPRLYVKTWYRFRKKWLVSEK